ncbi:MAG: hypothetical protein A2339_00365 [Elusimicrobia bacterium RIFOXYB12_FULL_50_12]|nr:MAG: hypothetical protein A2278_05945 [Elusimicrobia bacterium RIFOXYA12_FULL_49_49]OGS11319.1 MAG: hypothetical protein A2386_08365 [Elusimicrobia bacterium RIFOXYB1_FULL_48_9]OGS16664.1 MAG: hypothetical protein A2251_04790 [Elusimicrobia bacterium RIFOXYA2_FULL_47_53]OGS25513.1 MAG: hypothetical protein A2339_00365 [Elusimicrobia bacterium RIFOXYB12_FULL_50_12]OGS31642.1 MAG: hypothetical protein A2323_03510 [Elusimicrobia bacterium RIFOXYB2_FULL_46_23]
MKKILITCALLIISQSLFAAAKFKTGTLPLVDGVYNSTQAVITGRNPVFSWEYSSVTSSYTIVVSSDPATFLSDGEIWNFVGATTSVNTINFVTRNAYNSNGTAGTLSAGVVYYWRVTIYEDGTSAFADGQFTAAASVASLQREKFDLAVDWNNPFNPSKGQYTIFRYGSRDRDRRVKLRVYSLSGDLVQEWPEQTVLKDAWYSQSWDGKNILGETVARGMYFVNLVDVGDYQGITRRIAVIK